MNQNSFLEGKILPSLLKFALPLIFSLVLQALYGAVDLLVVGQFGTTASISAVAVGSLLMQMVTVIVTGLTMGVMILFGQAIGARDGKRAGEIVAGQIKLLLGVAIGLTVGLIFLAEPIVELMNVPLEARGKTVSYLRICGSGMVFIAAYNGISGVFRGMGNSKSPLLFVAVACVINIVLDLLFIGVFHMDVAGAALATVIAQAFSVVFSIFYMKRVRLPFVLTRACFKAPSIRSILKMGFPIALQDFLLLLSFVMISGIVNRLGVVASASLGITGKLFYFLALVPISFMFALSAFVAQNVGARQFLRAKKSLWIAMFISSLFGVSMFLVTFFWGGALARLFTADAQVIASSAAYQRGCSLEYLFLSIFCCILGYFNGHGRTTFVMIQSIFASFCVRVPLSFYFGYLENTSMVKISLAVPISAFVSLVLCVIYLFYFERKRKKMGMVCLESGYQ